MDEYSSMNSPNDLMPKNRGGFMEKAFTFDGSYMGVTHHTSKGKS